MKRLYINGIIKSSKQTDDIKLLGWIKSKRKSKTITFFDIIDSSGVIQGVVHKNSMSTADYLRINKIPVEASVEVRGKLKKHANVAEINIEYLKMIGDVNLDLHPNPRKNFDIFHPKNANYVLKNRHLFLRNEKMMAVLKFKNNFIFETHKWFKKQGFVFIDAPVLTELLLYDDDSAFKLDYRGKAKGKQEVFLSQCNMFQLEAAVHAFEKVYNLTPSFRAEPSRTNRHLREYWHLKAEIAWADLNDLVHLAEKMFYTITKNTIEKSKKELEILNVDIDLDKLKPPYQRITYDKALDILHSKGNNLKWGKSLGVDEEKILTRECGDNLIFIEGLPCDAEAFPFSRDKANPKITRTCDLISPKGFCEILGTAEKITNKKELLERMAEKSKNTKEQLKRYQWYIDLRDYGCVPHGGIGMGVERAIRFLLKLPHVRDAISFPRVYGRYPNP